MTARLLVQEAEGVVEHPPSRLSERRDRLCWLDVVGPDDDDFARIAEELDLHELALEDARHRHQRPKVDQYENHYFIVFYALAEPKPDQLHFEELSIFVMENALVTVHEAEFAARARVEKRMREGRLRSCGRLLHDLLDQIVDDYFPVVDAVGERVDMFEEYIVREASGQSLPTWLRELFQLKRELLLIRQRIAPEREVVNVLARGDLPFLREERVYFQDVYDHIVRATDQIDTFRDLTSNVIDAHLAAASNRLNEVMKVLTSVATVLLVLSLITGFFGMNFSAMPFDSTTAMWLTIVAMVVAGVVVAMYFRRRGWL
jgi:magnesium transporter